MISWPGGWPDLNDGVLYEDRVLPGGAFQQRTVLTLLQRLAGEERGAVPAPVHRLGRGTSGVLLCARSELARARLSAAFAHDAVADAAPRVPRGVASGGSNGENQGDGDPPPPAVASGGSNGENQGDGDPPPSTVASGGSNGENQGDGDPPSPAVGSHPESPAGAHVEGKAIRKTYLALASGRFAAEDTEICTAIGRVEYPGVRLLLEGCAPIARGVPVEQRS
eukprot:gene2292-3013_t